MRKSLDQLYKKQSLLYKYFLYIASICFIVFFFPKAGKFKYEYFKGQTWQYEDLRAPFDFSIQKTNDEVLLEKKEIESNSPDYYSYNQEIVNDVNKRFNQKFNTTFNDNDFSEGQLYRIRVIGKKLLDNIYQKGVFDENEIKLTSKRVLLIKDNEANDVTFSELLKVSQANRLIKSTLENQGLDDLEAHYKLIFEDLVKPNIIYNQDLSEKALNDELSKISYTRGNIDEGDLIITKGEVVELEDVKILDSLATEFESELWIGNNYYYILVGYTVLVALVLMMLFLFLKKYRKEISDNNTKVTFIIFNILLQVLVTTLVVKYNDVYVFVVPLCILPLILKTFFDARLGLYVHVLTVLILGFVVPNSFEYIFLQIIAGIVTILTVSELYKRANLFVSVAQITFIYLIGYLAFHVIHEGSVNDVNWFVFSLFLLNGMITLFVQPLIYIYEKLFGLVSDVSLLELSDTNSKLLKELSNKAPGTFHHSLQVANLAEAAANEVGANAMLVRVGALYHDIGKMENPTYFTENQITNVNPHDALTPLESGKIIVGHVIKGIEIARKNKLPDRVIDFIRSHHGTTLVYYFYKKQEEREGVANTDDFRYPGPLPFSKETAILMMADSVEAASKSLKNPTFLIIDEFVDKIISGQMNANQFLNADITFKEIESIKKIFKQKLTNIYHLRVEYPE